MACKGAHHSRQRRIRNRSRADGGSDNEGDNPDGWPQGEHECKASMNVAGAYAIMCFKIRSDNSSK